MNFRIKKVVVLGSGVMGSGIACHLANIGCQVQMLDVLPPKFDNSESENSLNRNQIAEQSLKNTLSQKPNPLYHKEFVKKIQTGNFDDHLSCVSEVDWIIEVIIEDLELKRALFEKVERYRKENTLVSSNTSSIPIKLLAEGRSENFRKHFCGIHFFNPPRYLRLLEVIPHKDTMPHVIDFFMEYGTQYLGKQTVLCKDKPAFIANRIGVMSGTKILQLTNQHAMTVEEVDTLTGSLIGRPNTATFRLQDLIGIDTANKVNQFVLSNIKGDEFIDEVRNLPMFKHIDFLLKNNFLGRKTGQGYYKKTTEKDENGKTIIHSLDLNTLAYRSRKKPNLPIAKEADRIDTFSKRLSFLINGDTREHQFFKSYFAALFSYTANRLGEICDTYYAMDDAMRTGYMWEYGPFEYWDLIGFGNGVNLIKEHSLKVPKWIGDLSDTNFKGFYKYQDGSKKYFNLNANAYEIVPNTKEQIILKTFAKNTPIFKNNECVVHDIGEGVMCVEFTSKMNAIGEQIGVGISKVIDIAENEGWKGIVIGNNSAHFCVGANLMNIGILAAQKDYDALLKLVADFQKLNMKIKTSKIPIVVATQGYVFGGGVEISMHCDAGIYVAESYIGLVEIGVGLLPGGGGTKEMVRRASGKYAIDTIKTTTLIEHFKTISTATVSTSAYEAFEHNYLINTKDEVITNTSQNINIAKNKVLRLAKNYTAPEEQKNITVLGQSGLSVLYTAINEYKIANFISEYDAELCRKIAYVMCGGDLTIVQNVSEQYLLDLEREAFLSMLGNQKTLDRIQYMLMNNKPLRN